MFTSLKLMELAEESAWKFIVGVAAYCINLAIGCLIISS